LLLHCVHLLLLLLLHLLLLLLPVADPAHAAEERAHSCPDGRALARVTADGAAHRA
jgi:hypothetical protein